MKNNEMTVNRLIKILNDVRNEFGGETEVKLFSGDDFSTPPEDDCYWSVVTDVMTFNGYKSFMNCKYSNNENSPKVFLKYE